MQPLPLPDRLWVVVAHQAGARIFFRDNPRLPVVPIERIDWPIGHAKNHQLVSDRPGTGRSWGPTEKNILALAREIAIRLDRAGDLDRFDHLLIVAGPRLLGLIRHELGAPSHARLAGTLDEDLGNIEDGQIPSRLAPLLAEYAFTLGLGRMRAV